ncbi:MAG: SdrD B-like domain-containing protein [Bacteroidota bacterium]
MNRLIFYSRLLFLSKTLTSKSSLLFRCLLSVGFASLFSFPSTASAQYCYYNPCTGYRYGVYVELENATDNLDGTATLCFKVRNWNRSSMNYVAFEMPSGESATTPANGTTYSNNKSYTVYNTSSYPYHSIKFVTQGWGIRNGYSDTFCYTMDADEAFSMDNIWVAAKVGYYTKYVNIDISECLEAALGNRVWKDDNKNGLQDSGEPGVGGVTVKLYECDGTFVKQKTTSYSGWYRFRNLPPGKEYYVEFSDIPDNYVFTQQDQGTEEWRDSDVDANGVTACVRTEPKKYNRKIDAGITMGCEITDGGTVGPDRFGCGPYDPDPIYSQTLPDNGDGQFEYVWLYSLDKNLPFEMWVEEPNSNSPDYDPHFIDKTCWLVRCARRVGCTDPADVAYSNVVVAKVRTFPGSDFTVPGGVCNATLTSLVGDPVLGEGITYSWIFDQGVPGTATGDTADVYWSLPGTYDITLTVDRNGCSTTTTKQITIDDCGVCDNVTSAGSIEGGDVACIVPFDPSPIMHKNDPKNGTGPLEYLWLMTNDPTIPQNQWTMIANSNNQDYDPDPVTETTYYMRCVRRAGCDSYRESNVIKVEIVENAESLCKPTDWDVDEFTIELDIVEGTTTGKYYLSPDDRKFITYTDGTALMEGLMIHTENSNRRWVATFWFENKTDYGTWTSGGGSFESGNHDENATLWDYYTLDPTRSTLEGKNKFKNKNLTLAPFSATDPIQMGEGANTENLNDGAFGKFSYTGDYTGNGTIKLSFEECTQICAPDPMVVLEVFLQGCYNPATGKMDLFLNQNGMLPLNQPFNVDPYNYMGTESVTVMPDSIVDWVLWKVIDSTTMDVLSEGVGLLDNTGMLRDLDGMALPTVTVPAGVSFYVSATAFGHLAAMCSNPCKVKRTGKFKCNLKGGGYRMNNRPGNPMCNLGNKKGLWCGNSGGEKDVINTVDILKCLQNLYTPGYKMGDCNRDGMIDYKDRDYITTNLWKSSHTPRK